MGLLVPLLVGASLGVINTEYLLCARSFPCFVLFKLHTCRVSVITFFGEETEAQRNSVREIRSLRCADSRGPPLSPQDPEATEASPSHRSQAQRGTSRGPDFVF